MTDDAEVTTTETLELITELIQQTEDGKLKDYCPRCWLKQQGD